MTGFEPGSSGIETTALPTAPQPLPYFSLEKFILIPTKHQTLKLSNVDQIAAFKIVPNYLKIDHYFCNQKST